VRASGASRRIGSEGQHNRLNPRQLEISNRWYTDLIPAKPAVESELEQNAHFAAGAGVGSGAVRLPDLRPLSDALPVPLKEPYCVMVPGAQNPYRRWPIERFAELARMLARDAPNLEIVLAGSAAEQHLAPPLQQASPHVRDLLGRTNLFQLIGLIAGAKFVVSNDTAAVHIAAMLGIPSAVPLGGAQVGRFLPYPAGATSAPPIVALHPMPCFGCQWNCIYYDDRDTVRPCIEGIEFAQIWSAVEKLIEETSSVANSNTAAP
jgi:ADP-heptose:LPS heptosyltransferase